MADFAEFLGEGSYGCVYLLGDKQEDGSMLYQAVKISSIEKYSALDKEFKILKKLKGCPSIVQVSSDNTSLVEETLSDSDGDMRVFCMSMEYAAGGTLHGFIQKNKTTKLSDPVIKEFTRMILRGLISIHGLGYVHCDLKPGNLLLFPRDHGTSYELKIADFGMCTKAGEQSDCWDLDAPFVGTYGYMSPESVQQSQVHQTLDLWSLGCIVLEMHTGKFPWAGLGIKEVEFNLMYDSAPPIPESIPCDARKFIEKCFSRKPEERGSPLGLLLHPYLIGDVKMDLGKKPRTRTTCNPKSIKIVQAPFKRPGHPRRKLVM